MDLEINDKDNKCDLCKKEGFTGGQGATIFHEGKRYFLCYICASENKNKTADQIFDLMMKDGG